MSGTVGFMLECETTISAKAYVESLRKEVATFVSQIPNLDEYEGRLTTGDFRDCEGAFIKALLESCEEDVRDIFIAGIRQVYVGGPITILATLCADPSSDVSGKRMVSINIGTKDVTVAIIYHAPYHRAPLYSPSYQFHRDYLIGYFSGYTVSVDDAFLDGGAW